MPNPALQTFDEQLPGIAVGVEGLCNRGGNLPNRGVFRQRGRGIDAGWQVKPRSDCSVIAVKNILPALLGGNNVKPQRTNTGAHA